MQVEVPGLPRALFLANGPLEARRGGGSYSSFRTVAAAGGDGCFIDMLAAAPHLCRRRERQCAIRNFQAKRHTTWHSTANRPHYLLCNETENENSNDSFGTATTISSSLLRTGVSEVDDDRVNI